MAHTEHGRPADPGAPRLNHEPTDAPLGSVERIIVAGGIFLAVSFALMWLLLGVYRSQAARTDTRLSPPAQAARAADGRQPLQRFPLPRLQELPALDMTGFNASQARVLHTYGWEDKGRGVVRIPIERAIEILAERGLDGATVPATTPGTAPGALAPSAVPQGAGAPAPPAKPGGH